jgi:hypothetical protein
MISLVLRLAALLCALVLLGSFAMFANDQAHKGSKDTIQRLGYEDNNQVQDAPPKQPKKPGVVRQRIDSASNALTRPFDGAAASGSQWTKHGVPTMIALLVFGGGLSFVARFVSTKGY